MPTSGARRTKRAAQRVAATQRHQAAAAAEQQPTQDHGLPTQDQEQVDTFCQLIGQQVMLMGLAAKPELNHKIGTVRRWIAESGRYSVELDDGSAYSLKRINLQWYVYTRGRSSVCVLREICTVSVYGVQ